MKKVELALVSKVELALVSIISKANSTFVLSKLGVSEPIKSCFLLESVCFCFYL